jgi:hypothetical protein
LQWAARQQSSETLVERLRSKAATERSRRKRLFENMNAIRGLFDDSVRKNRFVSLTPLSFSISSHRCLYLTLRKVAQKERERDGARLEAKSARELPRGHGGNAKRLQTSTRR